MYILLASAALAASCNAISIPWISRSTLSTPLPPLPIEHFNTPKYARPLSLDEALSGVNASVTTISDLQDAKNKFPPLVIPDHLSLPNNTQDLEDELSRFTKRQGTCSNPRVRTEWDHYSNSDRQAYIDSIKCLMTKPPSGQFSVSQSRYDDLVGLHQRLTPNVHGNAKFLLWHRYFVWTFEQLLRDECGFDRELPWFDETRYAGHFADSSIFSPQWFGSVNIGGQCVTDGVSIATTASDP
jgi:tyrosinase